MSTAQDKPDEPTVVSAPGKVLLSGGYLVMDQKYSGLVVSTSSRFYTVISTARHRKEGIVTVRSPQFKETVWEYHVRYDDIARVRPSEETPGNTNLVITPLSFCLQLAGELKGLNHVKNAMAHGLEITIVGENDFYSQRAKLAEHGLEPRMSSLAQIPPFAHTGVPLFQAHNTGLRSSAALTTSLVAALLLHLEVVPVVSGDDVSVHILHAASQVVHSVAQMEYESGFNVAAAVFGSHKYTRFNLECLSPFAHVGDTPLRDSSDLTVAGVLNKAWDHKVEPFKLPPGIRLMLADVDAGSKPRCLAMDAWEVLMWQQDSEPEVAALRDVLAASNEAFAAALLHLSELQSKYEERYNRALAQLTHLPASQWRSTDASDIIIQTFISVHELAEDIRVKMRDMCTRAFVSTEPPEQKALLDSCIAQEGVIAGGGGYDAFWLLVFDPRTKDITDAANTPQSRVERVWAEWKDLDVSPLCATESSGEGLRRERVDSVPGLAEVLERAA
ncbi:Phosphomevalonate kinase [Fomitiporia mediterranea MF3/22]|uniref:Phosphomevalonate kinase n=1 Tax=Fomitiporia mediterranea (strain MF3/22) TaxID=694068 RepID=UPI000440965F|nr:Phosphomevalonate kinase [Fomitiporia mediterranea MF3/22]EJD03368.1 Phosphomevalonate kinase [Fomitiporia mediterranea MF3/22]